MAGDYCREAKGGEGGGGLRVVGGGGRVVGGLKQASIYIVNKNHILFQGNRFDPRQQVLKTW